MNEHWSVDANAPTETADGEEIPYVWVVTRVRHGREDELLGIHDNEEDARRHAVIADRSGETLLRQQRLMQASDGKEVCADG